MFDSLIVKISSDATSELFFLLSGSLILYVLQTTYKKVKDFNSRRRLRAELLAYKKRKDAINVVDLENGDPEFEKQKIFSREVSIFGSSRCLYIGMPSDIQEKIISREREAGYMESQLSHFHPNTSFNGQESFEDIAELTGIKNLPALIDKHKVMVGEKFISSEDGLIFNGEKYGVFNLKFTRFGADEKQGVEIDFFKTDYYTHRVFRSIYHELKALNHPIAKAGVSDFIKYKPFFTSFGINAVLVCDGGHEREVILSKRSSRVAGGEANFHVTMNEGLSQTDKDPFGNVDLELCFKRGLLEELGINEKLYQYGIKAAFYDFFLEKNNFEIGLSSVFEINLDYEKDIEPLISRDKYLEIDSFVSLPLKSKDIVRFINNHRFIPHGLYVLERVLLRENISLGRGMRNIKEKEYKGHP